VIAFAVAGTSIAAAVAAPAAVRRTRRQVVVWIVG
jgi:hypothetical protein